METLVASLILAMGLLAVGAVYPRGMHAITMGTCRVKATNMAQKKMDELFQSAGSGDQVERLRQGTFRDEPEPNFSRTWSVSDERPDDGVLDLSVTVAWKLMGDERSVELKSLVAVRKDGT
jgi:hypothetical protein